MSASSLAGSAQRSHSSTASGHQCQPMRLILHDMHHYPSFLMLHTSGATRPPRLTSSSPYGGRHAPLPRPQAGLRMPPSHLPGAGAQRFHCCPGGRAAAQMHASPPVPTTPRHPAPTAHRPNAGSTPSVEADACARLPIRRMAVSSQPAMPACTCRHRPPTYRLPTTGSRLLPPELRRKRLRHL